MSEYLSKEEIKQWRSSLEKITLEEFAARLGKKVEEKKTTNDLIDIVLHGKPVISEVSEYSSKVERLSAIADRAYEREKDIYISPFSAENLKVETEKVNKVTTKKNEAEEKNSKSTTKTTKLVKPIVETKKETQPEKLIEKKTKTTKKVQAQKPEQKEATIRKEAMEAIADTQTNDELRNEVRVVFKKALTEREQKVFDYFTSHRNQIVYAKELAELLDLPRDYVYKYIKNLRAKIDGESLKNADKGGFILSA